MATAAAVVLVLAIRPVASVDIGYHLAYGDHFLRTGRIVQSGGFGIYTPLDAKILADPAQWGPGCRFDAKAGEYRFVNANWLSQIVFAVTHRLGGMTALCVLRAALILATFAVIALTMRRAGVGWAWIAGGIILAAVTAFERFDLRPELLSYLILAIQWHLLSGRKFTWRRAVAVVALQVLLVNVHGFFLLGVAITAAVLIDALVRWLWARLVTQTKAPEPTARLQWLAVAAGGVVVACLCNPWLLRGAVLPIETMAYIRAHSILGVGARIETVNGQGRLAGHPWSLIGEIIPTFHPALRAHPGTIALRGVLVLTAMAGVIALVRRRVGWLLVTAGVVVVAVSSRRNIAMGGMFLVMLSMISFAGGWAWLRKRWGSRLGRTAKISTVVMAAITVLAGAALAIAVVRNTWYVRNRLSGRFGLGVSSMMIPTGPARWINRHRPAGRVWSDFANSSNLLFLTGRDMPLLTNTWSHPPYLMARQMEIAAGLRPLAPFADANDVNVAVFRPSPLIRELTRNGAWAVVQIEPRRVMLVRASGATAELAAEHGLTERSLDARRLVDRIVAQDPAAADGAVYDTAMTFPASRRAGDRTRGGT